MTLITMFLKEAVAELDDSNNHVLEGGCGGAR